MCDTNLKTREQSPSTTVSDLPPILSNGEVGSPRQSLLLFFTTAFAKHLDATDPFLSNVINKLYRNLSKEHGPSVLTLEVTVAVVDKVSPRCLSQWKFEEDPLASSEGVAFLANDSEATKANFIPKLPGVENSGPSTVSISFGLVPVDERKANTVRVQPANTLFHNGRGATFFHSTWKLDGQSGILRSTDRHDIQDLSINFPLLTEKVSHRAPLIPLTVPRRVEQSFGNVIRLVSELGSEGRGFPASRDLEESIPAFLTRRLAGRQGQGPQSTPLHQRSPDPDDQLLVYAAILPPSLLDSTQKGFNSALEGYQYYLMDEERIRTFSMMSEEKASTIYPCYMAEGATFHRVLGGGGGWGNSAGLVSVEPMDMFQYNSNAPSSGPDVLDGDDILPGFLSRPVAPPGCFIQFFVAAHAVDVDARHLFTSPAKASFTVGCIPESGSEASLLLDAPPTLFTPDHIGLLSTKAIGYSFGLSKKSTAMPVVSSTAVDIPFSRAHFDLSSENSAEGEILKTPLQGVLSTNSRKISGQKSHSTNEYSVAEEETYGQSWSVSTSKPRTQTSIYEQGIESIEHNAVGVYEKDMKSANMGILSHQLSKGIRPRMSTNRQIFQLDGAQQIAHSSNSTKVKLSNQGGSKQGSTPKNPSKPLTREAGFQSFRVRQHITGFPTISKIITKSPPILPSSNVNTFPERVSAEPTLNPHPPKQRDVYKPRPEPETSLLSSTPTSFPLVRKHSSKPLTSPKPIVTGKSRPGQEQPLVRRTVSPHLRRPQPLVPIHPSTAEPFLNYYISDDNKPLRLTPESPARKSMPRYMRNEFKMRKMASVVVRKSVLRAVSITSKGPRYRRNPFKMTKVLSLIRKKDPRVGFIPSKAPIRKVYKVIRTDQPQAAYLKPTILRERKIEAYLSGKHGNEDPMTTPPVQFKLHRQKSKVRIKYSVSALGPTRKTRWGRFAGTLLPGVARRVRSAQSDSSLSWKSMREKWSPVRYNHPRMVRRSPVQTSESVLDSRLVDADWMDLAWQALERRVERRVAAIIANHAASASSQASPAVVSDSSSPTNDADRAVPTDELNTLEEAAQEFSPDPSNRKTLAQRRATRKAADLDEEAIRNQVFRAEYEVWQREYGETPRESPDESDGPRTGPQAVQLISDIKALLKGM